MTETAAYDLAARYSPSSEGPLLLTGLQAVARFLTEQHARDAAAGLHTASFVSGYQGSPLGGLDRLLAGVAALREHDVHLIPGLNEELAATAVWGSQQELPGHASSHDGVVGVWYGKAPGVDRAGDAIRHGNTMGANPRGGVLVLAGDDPAAKSSTLPSASARTLAAYGLPVLYPRNSEEVVTLGLCGIALSRASGCWVGMVMTTDVADGLWSVPSGFDARIDVPALEWDGAPWTYTRRGTALPPASLLAEQDLVGPRWAMVRAFADANALDRITSDGDAQRVGIVAPGKTYDDVIQALADLGVASADIRLLRLGLVHPLSPKVVSTFAAGLERILVVEEKTAFVETQLRELLYGTDGAPAILGKADLAGARLVPADGELTAGRIAEVLGRVLGVRVPMHASPSPVVTIQRTPYFCSGCPHNTSTVVPEGSLAGGGIGCHGMAALMPRSAGSLTGLTQMGGEGAQWIGQAAFTTANHLFQNMGDGTYFHSGQLAVQACIAADVNVTFKLLYNGTVAMTGGQDAQGSLEVPALTRKLHADGVRRIIVCADEPRHYDRDATWAPGVDVWPRERLDEAQRLLRDTPGVTVLIYDQDCAAEVRRRRKRGLQAERTRRVVINEEVCEGCGDCGVKSNCLSVQPADTEFGRKTRIDQTSCNTDYSCLEGDCPSFVTVEVPPSRAQQRRKVAEPPESPDPAPFAGTSCDVVLSGIGGTGIVTVNQVLATAALRDGLHVRGLDQTGLSQKAGPVTSHVRLTRDQPTSSNRVSPGHADCYLAFDLVTAVEPRSLGYLSVDRTYAIVSESRTPTGRMVADSTLTFPDGASLLAELTGRCKEVVALDALGAAEALFGDTVTANFLLVGAAYQAGALPMSAERIEEAIEINGVAVARNVAAFRWGRAAVSAPELFAAATTRAASSAQSEPLPDSSPLAGETRRLAEVRSSQLRRYQGKRLADRYVSLVEHVWLAERSLGARTELSEAVAKSLHHVLAYKDEYEVARMLTDPAFRRRLATEVPGGKRVRMHLHPPVLRAFGMKKKIAVGRGGQIGLRALARLRFLRGTRLDPFGRTTVRRVERSLARHHAAWVAQLPGALTLDGYDNSVAIAEAPLLVKGYEEIKLATVERYQARLAELGVVRP